MGEEHTADVVIVGAGAAGLATAACLKRLGPAAIVLEGSDEIGHAWASGYDALRLHTVRRYSRLPLRAMPRSYPRYASRDQVVTYLQHYARRLKLDVRLNRRVERVERLDDGWRVWTASDTFTCRVLVCASGIVANPVLPTYPGMETYRGTLAHSSMYRSAAPFAGQRVLVVGTGNSGAEIALDLLKAAQSVTLSIRNGLNVVPLSLLGVPIQYWALLVARLPRPVTAPLAKVLLRRSAERLKRAGLPPSSVPVLESEHVPVIGLGLLDAVRSGRIGVMGAIERFTESGVVFVDGTERDYDAVLRATGFRPALSYLTGLVTLDGRGFPAREGARSLDQPDLYFVGLNYGIVGTLNNIRKDAPVAAKQIAASLAKGARSRATTAAVSASYRAP